VSRITSPSHPFFSTSSHALSRPRNILVNSDCQLKIADFGLARIYNEQNNSKIVAMTEYVTTRWYRAPEVLVGWAQYTTGVDMWAVGCIVAELVGRTPIFPGADSLQQLTLICQCLGKPSAAFIKACRKPICRWVTMIHVI
jgi:serine/threonine protein kinase